MEENKIIVFEGNKIRRILHDDERYFSVVDVISVLTTSTVPKRYRSDLKSKLTIEGSQVYEKIVQLKLPAGDGKKYSTDCANTENMFRIVQSIPSPKAEPFKRRLAKVGYERVQEIENPELAQERMKEIYQQK
jgi:DNA-damage-inducible protein D